ncbi:MAG TPA: DUF2062 domain-containing protein [Sphingomonas sp.]|nr:DUF2062 domain-containing protein [Sphingomonas sp.]
MESNRLLRPVAHRVLAPALWRFTRRSVPRGVALGMIAGIMVPFGQVAVAAVAALPFRANIPAAALTTFLTNPLTTPPLWVLAYWIGRSVLRLDAHVTGAPVARAASGWLQWFMEAGPATATGLLVLSVVFAVVGYALSALGWRLWIGNKWRKRRMRNAN